MLGPKDTLFAEDDAARGSGRTATETLSPSPPQTGARRPSRSRAFPCAIYCRTTVWEKQRIAQQAAAARVSLSRFLVRCAITGKAPPTNAEVERLERLAFRFQVASMGLKRLAAQASVLKALGAEPEMVNELDEMSDLLRALARDIARRLRS